MAGYQLTSGQMKAIRETVRTVMNQFRGSMPSPGQMQVQRCLTVRLSTALAAASNAADSPGTGTGVVVAKQADGELRNTSNTISIVNRFEHISLEQDTLAIAMWIDGEWRLISGDCDALSFSTRLTLAGS
jgi:hypothetical protein